MNADWQRCQLCGALDDLLRCSRCKSTYYCSKEHQRLHWKEHRRHCRRLPHTCEAELEEDICAAVADSTSDVVVQVLNPTTLPMKTTERRHGGNHSPPDSTGIDRLSSQYAHLTTRTMNCLPVDASGPDRSRSATDDDGRLPPDLSGYPLSTEPAASLRRSSPPYLHRNPRSVPSDVATANSQWMQTMCQYVIRDMDRYGICVIDNFAGHDVGGTVLDEVVSMYGGGGFMDGELMSNPSGNSSQTIRGDKIAWVDGSEPGCSNIGYLVRLVDNIVMKSNRMPRNGKLGQYVISDRTRAMVACYPGSGTQYVKHVDNPNKDGRCITCIYYLNKDWDVKRDGGLLRIFPKGWTTSVADIDPTFDRILLFWSDRRNPHEVQPALRTRYAITVWYYDKVEREAARQLRPDARQIDAGRNASGIPNL